MAHNVVLVNVHKQRHLREQIWPQNTHAFEEQLTQVEKNQDEKVDPISIDSFEKQQTFAKILITCIYKNSA